MTPEHTHFARFASHVTILALSLFSLSVGLAQDPETAIPPTDRPEVMPPHWFIGMPNDTLEILLHARDIGMATYELNPTDGKVKLLARMELPNPNWLILRVVVPDDAEPTTLHFSDASGRADFAFALKARSSRPRGLDGADLIYLVTPDRFANGDPTNDSLESFAQVGIDRQDPYARHGGDIQGITDHLDHIQNLGATALWPNPLLENNQPLESYHGYAVTDHYRIDPRLGSNADFRSLCDALHQRDMKMVMDVVYNHIGDHHPLYRDIPDSSWFHFWPQYTRTNYRATTLMDPYASQYDKRVMTEGWFDKHMPDLDQTNPRMARYLIQQTLWWVEEFEIDALRIDTYAYPDQDFMRRWGLETKQAFPELFLFGETWVHGPTVQAWFLGDALGPTPNGLDALTDFQTHYAINEALSREQGWTEGISRLYYTLASDYIYPHPERLITFLDNHDVARFFGVVNRDMRKFTLGLGLLFTLRGIPSLYYGTEILMAETDGHGLIREDFPGGWPEDSVDKFSAGGRTEAENNIQNLIAKLAAIRRQSPALHSGKTTQFVPVDGLYVFFRHSDDQTIMVAVNTSEEMRSAPRQRFGAFLKNSNPMRNMWTGQIQNAPDTFKIKPMSIDIREVFRERR